MDTILEQQCRAMEAVLKYDEIAFIFINDDIAYKNGLIIRPEWFRELFVPRMERLVAPARAKGKLLTFHTDGDLSQVIPILVELGFAGVHPVEPAANDIYTLKAQYAGQIALFGNIDTTLLAFGTPAEVEADVRHHLDKLKAGGGYVLSSSSSLFDGIPFENVVALIETVNRYGQY